MSLLSVVRPPVPLASFAAFRIFRYCSYLNLSSLFSSVGGSATAFLGLRSDHCGEVLFFSGGSVTNGSGVGGGGSAATGRWRC